MELTADTGACDTVMPRSMAAHIPIQLSLQALESMMYEVADGNEIPNLGETMRHVDRDCIGGMEDQSPSRRRP